jgi:hypothetical protein
MNTTKEAARADERIQPRLGARLREHDEEDSKECSGTGGFGQPAPRSIARLRRSGRDRDYGDDRKCDAGHRERGRQPALERAEADRYDRGEDRRDRRNDPHRANRESAVQERDRSRAEDAA